MTSEDAAGDEWHTAAVPPDVDDPGTAKRMPLRYPGTCRGCGAEIPAGTEAFYERSTRTVRCLTCDPMSDTAPSEQDDLRTRAPASAVITELLRMQSTATPLSRAARLFGRSPLSPEANSWYVGAIGELEVGRLLDRLAPEWHVTHAIQSACAEATSITSSSVQPEYSRSTPSITNAVRSGWHRADCS